MPPLPRDTIDPALGRNEITGLQHAARIYHGRAWASRLAPSLEGWGSESAKSVELTNITERCECCGAPRSIRPRRATRGLSLRGVPRIRNARETRMRAVFKATPSKELQVVSRD